MAAGEFANAVERAARGWLGVMKASWIASWG
jgi:hypothetical protein